MKFSKNTATRRVRPAAVRVGSRYLGAPDQRVNDPDRTFVTGHQSKAGAAENRRPRPFYAASAICPLMVNPSAPAETRTVSPSLTAPSRISPANGFCRLRWITRFSGRAP